MPAPKDLARELLELEVIVRRALERLDVATSIGDPRLIKVAERDLEEATCELEGLRRRR